MHGNAVLKEFKFGIHSQKRSSIPKNDHLVELAFQRLLFTIWGYNATKFLRPLHSCGFFMNFLQYLGWSTPTQSSASLLKVNSRWYLQMPPYYREWTTDNTRALCNGTVCRLPIFFQRTWHMKSIFPCIKKRIIFYRCGEWASIFFVIHPHNVN